MATARQRWNQLERRLWHAIRRADQVDVRDAKADPEHIWGPTRTVRAAILRELLLSGPSPLPGHIGSLRLAGARITGELDLGYSRIEQPFEFLECWFDEPIDLSAARTQAVFIQDCRVPGMDADALRAEGELNLDGSLFTARLDLTDAHISGPVVLAGAQLFNPDGVALAADGAEFGNDVFCRNGFRSTGPIHLSGARIEGDLDFATATLANPAGDALLADSAKIGGNLLAIDDFRATGRISLNRTTIDRDAAISGTLDCPDGVALDCGGAEVGGDLSARESVVVGEFSMVGAHVNGRIDLGGIVLSNPGGDAFTGTGLHTAAGMLCGEGLLAVGEFSLSGAHIGGVLTFGTATLSNPGAIALIANRMVVDGHTFFDEGFSAAGEMRVLGMKVHGQLSINDATLSNPGASALVGDGMTVDGDFFGYRCRVEGEMHIIAARVGGDVDFRGAVLVNDGNTLMAESLDVGGNLYCCYGFSSTGQIMLGGARIRQQFLLDGATLHNPGQDVLRGRHLTVGEDIYADEDFTVRGTLDLSACRVTGAIWLGTENVETVNLTQTRADLLQLTGPPGGQIALEDVTVRVLRHAPEDWPDTGKLDLQGLTYTTLQPLDLPATRWLDWLRRGLPYGYRPQPYAQLAATLRNVGNDRDARVVLLARQRHRRRHLPLWSKPWGWLQDAAVGYGFVPWRAAGWLGVLWLAGWLYFRTQTPLPGGSGDYQPALYALDLLLPVLSIGQRSAVHFTGTAQLIAVLITVCSWILGIAVLAGLTRALTRN